MYIYVGTRAFVLFFLGELYNIFVFEINLNDGSSKNVIIMKGFFNYLVIHNNFNHKFIVKN